MHNATWTFEGGQLVARNLAGAKLGEWLTDGQLGRPLANLLNQAPSLARLLLPPWASEAEAITAAATGGRPAT